MSSHIENREKIIQFLREELFGPSPQGEGINFLNPLRFDDEKDFYKPWKENNSGEEILQRDSPTNRYGLGVLFPMEVTIEENFSDDKDCDDDLEENQDPESELRNDWIVDDASGDGPLLTSDDQSGIVSDSDDFELTTANSFRPSSMAVSFLADFPQNSVLIVNVTGGRYSKKAVKVKDKDRIWWVRSPVRVEARFDSNKICLDKELKVEADNVKRVNCEGLDLSLGFISRPHGSRNKRLCTLCLVNRTRKNREPSSDATIDNKCLFQSFFKISVISSKSDCYIEPYPGKSLIEMNDEEKSLALLYRKTPTFAVGHGCAANWEVGTECDKAKWVSAECLPVVEIPSVTPDIFRQDGSLLEISMVPLAGLVPGDDGLSSLAEVIKLYRDWIRQKSIEIDLFDKETLKIIARKHLEDCQNCSDRMEKGLIFLKEDYKAKQAFQLANHAMLLQQIQSRREPRQINFEKKSRRITLSEAYQEPDPLNPGHNKGKWRPFQIAFLLMSLQSAAKGSNPEREIVDLIWFPTGGGKTEAYLGLSAFSIFYRRMINPEDSGVNVLMRYTLRLLTAQQFQRASTLACSMEYLRKKIKNNLGGEIAIGIWVGGATSPNSRQNALTALREMNKNRNAENLFILGRCPWCGAQMGRIEGSLPKGMPRILGFEARGNTVALKCTDNYCPFNDKLPVYVIDEDIYEKRPSIVIGTVDKFAMLAWRPEARSLFGIEHNGERVISPPQLVLQDELHLISGPLGSMVGLYEAVIEHLCTDLRSDNPIKPKIVCSTATIRRYSEQVKEIFGRNQVALFPPPGLEADNSFFSGSAKDNQGRLLPGKKYIGIHAPGLGSIQTAQVRTLTALLQGSFQFTYKERDPWWTLLIFFNSLRELGITRTLFQSDIIDYFQVLKNRLGLELLREINSVLELTGRVRGDQIPKAISDLEVSCTKESDPVDACLASNIIEVGVDIDRLSLMCVVGQPKTTSQYIQVTGRVGRKWEDRPGLIVMLYNASKPRDRSHFEQFRSYHENLYAQVEPASSTPFSPPALDRALHAVMISFVRQSGDLNLVNRPLPFPEDVINCFKEVILRRVSGIDEKELANTKKVLEEREREWKKWERTTWTYNMTGDEGQNIPLLRIAGSYATREAARLSWSTPMSLRNVDAECRAAITTLYIQKREDDHHE